jgi:hypothetical protein
MTPAIYEQALLALQSYRAAMSDDILEMLAIACVFRNRVHRFGKSYTQILEDAEVSRPWPAINHPILSTPYTGLLSQIEGIYKGDTADYTANHNFKNGALYFGRAQEHQRTGDWFEENILKNQKEHPLIGQFGAQHFYV